MPENMTATLMHLIGRHSHGGTRYCSNVKLMVFLPFSVGAICPPSHPLSPHPQERTQDTFTLGIPAN